ncbi:hypothetical protein [Candidatus Dactylopiibacterium carminicum]|uniref:hypothetical protein n=1 Tax=Candidatus Dactylopiibacterium carminicum TaxID=857335 RepID=UPI001140A8F7|nr:hypothetical protein [Candidatus Dactylopiibacterium carminicum]
MSGHERMKFFAAGEQIRFGCFHTPAPDLRGETPLVVQLVQEIEVRHQHACRNPVTTVREIEDLFTGGQHEVDVSLLDHLPQRFDPGRRSPPGRRQRKPGIDRAGKTRQRPA